ncbi:MAG: hypothetical protein QM781_19435 [Chitinophagaceae bacterium]
MDRELLKIGLRYQAIYLDATLLHSTKVISPMAIRFVESLRQLGYTVEERLLHQLSALQPGQMITINKTIAEVLNVNNNWAPLDREWSEPAATKGISQLIKFFTSSIQKPKTTVLPCGHAIPENTFPLERYNGCPFCGQPFIFAGIENMGQGSKLKALQLWVRSDMERLFKTLLMSATPLDADQVKAVQELSRRFPLPQVNICMKETLMLVVDELVQVGYNDQAATLFTSPVDIMRYLWYKQTGFLQLIEPKTIKKRQTNNYRHLSPALNVPYAGKQKTEQELILHYNRQQCKMVAGWLNALPIDAEKACELMHPKRSMWVRFIRALRLAEYARKKGNEKLAQLLDVFYNEKYTVWTGDLQQARLKFDAETTFSMLQKRPGLFARSLFANMLWFGADDAIQAFKKVVDEVPARLLISLNSYADIYFDPAAKRYIKPLGGTAVSIAANQLVTLYDKEQLIAMQKTVEELCLDSMAGRYAAEVSSPQKVYIDPALYKLPLPVGDRSELIKDVQGTPMGARFKVEGSTIRLFMQWGKGLPAQHMDMDLSCRIIYTDHTDVCAYYKLTTTGAAHSGDIRSIPDKIGTAEYINLDLGKLGDYKARYVVFTSNAYSHGTLAPNLVLGWMDSAFPMKVSPKTGVAYDPSCVQQQVKVGHGLTKGLVFGVLDVLQREIIWLELPFGGQITENMSLTVLDALIKKLENKLSFGTLLLRKMKAQNHILVENPAMADKCFDLKWAMQPKAVAELIPN